MRVLSCLMCCSLFAAFSLAEDPKPAAGQWVNIKGTVVFPAGKDIPKRAPLNVTQDKPHCLKDGPILDESMLINANNRGIKNVIVYLRPDVNDPKATFKPNQIHPDDTKRKPADVVIDQPCCMFVQRITVARVGDTLVVKNPSPVAHNFFWSTQNNGEHNPNIPPGQNWKSPKPLVAEGSTPFKCIVHPWMSGTVRIFDHPYYAVTDADGKFEIKNAPAGKFRIAYWHENRGARTDAQNRLYEPIQIAGQTMEMKPTDFDVTSK